MAALRISDAGPATRVTVHLPPDLLAWVQAVATHRRRPVGEVIREALAAWAAAHPVGPA